MQIAPRISALHLIGLQVLRRKRGWFYGLGALLILAGTGAVIYSSLATVFAVLVIGWMLILVGSMEIIHAISTKGWSGFFLDLLSGILYTAAGIIIVLRPETASIALTLVIALLLLLVGTFRLLIGIFIPFSNRIWLALHGLVTLALGILILQQWPDSGLWVIGLFMGIEMMMNGWALVMLGFAASRIPELPIGTTD